MQSLPEEVAFNWPSDDWPLKADLKDGRPPASGMNATASTMDAGNSFLNTSTSSSWTALDLSSEVKLFASRIAPGDAVPSRGSSAASTPGRDWSRHSVHSPNEEPIPRILSSRGSSHEGPPLKRIRPGSVWTEAGSHTSHVSGGSSTGFSRDGILQEDGIEAPPVPRPDLEERSHGTSLAAATLEDALTRAFGAAVMDSNSPRKTQALGQLQSLQAENERLRQQNAKLLQEARLRRQKALEKQVAKERELLANFTQFGRGSRTASAMEEVRSAVSIPSLNLQSLKVPSSSSTARIEESDRSGSIASVQNLVTTALFAGLAAAEEDERRKNEPVASVALIAENRAEVPQELQADPDETSQHNREDDLAEGFKIKPENCLGSDIDTSPDQAADGGSEEVEVKVIPQLLMPTSRAESPSTVQMEDTARSSCSSLVSRLVAKPLLEMLKSTPASVVDAFGEQETSRSGQVAVPQILLPSTRAASPSTVQLEDTARSSCSSLVSKLVAMPLAAEAAREEAEKHSTLEAATNTAIPADAVSRLEDDAKPAMSSVVHGNVHTAISEAATEPKSAVESMAAMEEAILSARNSLIANSIVAEIRFLADAVASSHPGWQSLSPSVIVEEASDSSEKSSLVREVLGLVTASAKVGSAGGYKSDASFFC